MACRLNIATRDIDERYTIYEKNNALFTLDIPVTFVYVCLCVRKCMNKLRYNINMSHVHNTCTRVISTTRLKSVLITVT